MLKKVLKQLFRQHGRNQEGQAEISQAPRPGAPAMREATRRFNADDLAAAQAIADEVARHDPQQHQAWNLLGAIAAHREQHELAVRHFERAITLAPSSADYLSNCGEVCRRAGWLDDAIEHCRAAIATDSRHMGAHYNLALALHAVGEVESAHAALVSALAIQPDARILRSVLLFQAWVALAENCAWVTCRRTSGAIRCLISSSRCSLIMTAFASNCTVTAIRAAPMK